MCIYMCMYIYNGPLSSQEKYGQTIRAEEWMEMESSNSNIIAWKRIGGVSSSRVRGEVESLFVR